MSTSPLPKKKVVATEAQKEAAYTFEIQFNERAELININTPSDLNAAKTLNHLAVAVLFLAETLANEGQ